MIRGAAHKGFVLALCASACASCTRQVQTASRAAAPAVMARQVRNAVDAGEGDIELRTLRQRVAANPKDLDARVLLARRYSRRGLPDLALEHYRLAAGRFPDAVVVTLEMAKMLREMRETEEALTVVHDYLSRHPGRSWGLLSLEGILEDERGRFGAAEASHRAALALEPERSALHNNLGYNLLLQGRLDSAVKEFRRAIELDPKSEIAHNNLGAALASQSLPMPEEVLSAWERSSGPAVAHNNIAAVLMEQGRWAEARTEIEKSLGFRRDLPAALANLRLLAEADGRPATAPAASPATAAEKRRASIWSKIFGSRSGMVGAAGGAQKSGSGSATSELSGGQAGPIRVDTAERK